VRHLLILAVAVAVLFYVARGTVIPGPYTYDEPDYMYAVSLGGLANAIDSPTMPLTEFVNIGLDRGREPGAKLELSDRIRSSGDVVFYRHWHGPVYSDWLGVVKHFSSSELTTREWNYVFPVVAAVLMYFGALWLMPGAAGQTAAILAAVLYLWSYPVVRSTELGPHQLFSACATAALLLTARMFDGPLPSVRSCWYAAVVIAAVAFCALEVAFVLIFTMLVCGYLLRARLEPDLAFAARTAGFFVATVLLLWPAAIVKLSFVKAYLFMAYLALVRPGAWGSGATIAETWRLRLIDSPVPWVLAAAGAVYFVTRWREARVLIPFALFSLSMSAAILPVKTTEARYSLPFWPGLVLFAACSTGMLLSKWKPAARFTAVALLCVAMLATSWPSLRRGLPRLNTRCVAMLALIRDQGLEHKPVLVPHEDWPMLHYYFSGSQFRQYEDANTIPEQIRNAESEGVIDRSDPPRWIPSGPR
jgi:hypothetical protein